MLQKQEQFILALLDNNTKEVDQLSNNFKESYSISRADLNLTQKVELLFISQQDKKDKNHTFWGK